MIRLAARVGVLWLALYAYWLVFESDGERGVTLFSDSGYLVPIAAAAALAALAARRAEGTLRRPGS